MASTRYLTVGEVISRARSQSFAMLYFGLTVIALALMDVSKAQSSLDRFVMAGGFVLGPILIGLSIWRFMRLRRACRAVGYATDGSSRLSGTK